MKKLLKIILISLTSLIILTGISISIILWIVFTPEKLTPIVRDQSARFMPYPTEIGEVELTFYSTFPRFGIRLGNIAVISGGGMQNDTLMSADELTGVIDAKAYWKNNEIIISKFIVNNGYLNLFTDSLGQSNYGLLMTETSSEAEESSDPGYDFIDLGSIELKNLDLTYTDLSARIITSFTGLKANISGNLRGDQVEGRLDLSNAVVSLEYEGEEYLNKANIKLNLPLKADIPRQLLQMDEAFASVDGLEITFSGSVENDTILNGLVTDIKYKVDSWQLKNALALFPPEYLSEYGLKDASGILSSYGVIKGILSDSLMPLMDIHLTLNQGDILYDELPFPLSEMNGDIHIYADLNNYEASYLSTDRFEAKTPQSSFITRGKINNFLDDMHFSLVTDADVLTDEFHSFIPDDMSLSFGGRVKGQVVSDFTMSQAMNMEMEDMKMSGSVLLTGFNMVYDSISVESGSSGIVFALPNPESSDPDTRFASLKIASDNLNLTKPGEYSTSLKNAHIYMEMSDVRDTTLIPSVFCTFRMDSLTAGMDTLQVAINKPLGHFKLSPSPGNLLQPAIQLAYTSFKLDAKMGRDSAVIDDITIHADIINDPDQEDIFLQWQANGYIDMREGSIYTSSLAQAIEIPFIKMEFSPETFNIEEGNVRIEQSDFQLTGAMTNVLSYFRGDSILKGDFIFNSGHTDLAQVMNLTSGIGMEESELDESPSPESNEGSQTGPYMVPKGMDILLHANVQRASMGTDTAININGDVRVKDGILLLDKLVFTTPAADMQLTAMYRTPRKNHLYLGLDYHMFDVEISRLLQMIPDIDTLMPMLRSFDGSGEFHIAIETYLDSLYNYKKSTLRGASSIKGEDLVLMDGETFSEIAQTLRFSKRAENRVDSLSAEFTIFREEIDVYPFLLVMDRYKAVVAGRHNFDLTFDYHISMVDSPLPFRFGVDIKGNADDLKYRPAPTRYAEFYRPASRRAVESRQLELRQMIREALLENVRE